MVPACRCSHLDPIPSLGLSALGRSPPTFSLLPPGLRLINILHVVRSFILSCSSWIGANRNRHKREKTSSSFQKHRSAAAAAAAAASHRPGPEEAHTDSAPPNPERPFASRQLQLTTCNSQLTTGNSPPALSRPVQHLCSRPIRARDQQSSAARNIDITAPLRPPSAYRHTGCSNKEYGPR